MKKSIKIILTFIFFLSFSYLNLNGLKADNNSDNAAYRDISESGTIISLNPGAKSGLILDELGNVKEFHYAGLEVLEIGVDYVYIVQISAKGKIIIRDIHRR